MVSGVLPQSFGRLAMMAVAIFIIPSDGRHSSRDESGPGMNSQAVPQSQLDRAKTATRQWWNGPISQSLPHHRVVQNT